MRRRSRRKHDTDSGSQSERSSGHSERSSSHRTRKSATKSEVESTDSAKKKETNNEHLMVALRIRPLKKEEESRGYIPIADKVDEKMVVLREPKNRSQDVLRKNRNPERQYIFDKAFGPDASQEEVYEATTKKLVENVLQGYNATVFAYGATGGGKTYTMVGTRDCPGIMVRALNHLFNEMEADTEAAHKVTMSYLEIYNECIRDLLEPESGFLELRNKNNII